MTRLLKLNKAVFVDLDSTLALTHHRHHQAPEDRTDQAGWTNYSDNCDKDEIVEGTRQLVNILAKDHVIIICSSRSEIAREVTEIWLEAKNVIYDVLILQDYSKSDHNNGEHKVSHIRHYRDVVGLDIVLALEDWPATASMIESEGVPVVCVNPRYDEGYFSGGSPL